MNPEFEEVSGEKDRIRCRACSQSYSASGVHEFVRRGRNKHEKATLHLQAMKTWSLKPVAQPEPDLFPESSAQISMPQRFYDEGPPSPTTLESEYHDPGPRELYHMLVCDEDNDLGFTQDGQRFIFTAGEVPEATHHASLREGIENLDQYSHTILANTTIDAVDYEDVYRPDEDASVPEIMSILRALRTLRSAMMKGDN